MHVEADAVPAGLTLGATLCFLRVSLELQPFPGPNTRPELVQLKRSNVGCATPCCGAWVGAAVTGRRETGSPFNCSPGRETGALEM